MRKKIFLTAMALIMVMCLVPGSAFAVEPENSNCVPPETQCEPVDMHIAKSSIDESYNNEADTSENPSDSKEGDIEPVIPVNTLPPEEESPSEKNVSMRSSPSNDSDESHSPVLLSSPLTHPGCVNTIDIPGEKKWNDAGYEGKRPNQVIINLYADGKKVNGKSLVLTAGDKWKGTFSNLPKYKFGKEIKYTVAEEPLKNYTTEYTQPVPETASVSCWSEKITPASQSTYSLNGNMVLAKKGNQYFIWTSSSLSDAQKNHAMTAVNNANLQGIGKSLDSNNTMFANGLPASFDNGKIIIKTLKGATKIIFDKSCSWSLFYSGVLAVTKSSGWTVTNTYKTPTPPVEPKPASVIIKASKTLDGKAPSDDAFTFVLKDANGKTLQTKSNKGSNVTFDPLLFSEIGKYQYSLEEAVGSDSKIQYDNAVYTATVTVTEPKNGAYQATLYYEIDGEAYNETPVFANSTKTTPPIIEPPADDPPEDKPPTSVDKVNDKTASSNDVSTQTGDNNNMTPWIILMLLSALCIPGTLLGRKYSLRNKQ